MTKEELKNNIIELKESCRKLAEEYREKYNHDNSNKIALNMFYHNVISYNDYESVLALIENRNSVIMAFSAPPVLTEETVEVNLKRIAELEKENAELKEKLNFSTQYYQGEKAKEQLTEAKEIIKMLHSDCYSIAECEDTNLGLWEDDLAKAEQFISEVEK